MAGSGDDLDRRPRHVGVKQKSHTRLCGGQRVVGLLLSQISNELERRPYVVASNVVLSLDLFESHPASQAANDNRHRQPSAPNDRAAVSNGRIKDDAVGDDHSVIISYLLRVVDLQGIRAQCIGASQRVLARQITRAGHVSY